MKHYILHLPRFDKYYFLLFEFVADKKFQIQRAWYQESDMIQGRSLYLQITIYFPIEDLHKYFLDNVTKKELQEYGEPSYIEKLKKVPRKYTKRLKTESPKGQELL